ncbi:MAG: MmcB family DNA repair protein [Aequoribacter sp.]|uniref:MmcB family DNA repair protein n=1 Tax=Aequoribacter sp. TaxID=2847771 RepID=UPI003C343529
MKTIQMEAILATHFNYVQNIIVPNVQWGMGVHECDLFILRPSGYAVEVEIKVSKSDLIKDKEKWHEHRSYKIKELWFAIPEKLEPYIEHIPERAGIAIVRPYPNGWGRVERVRQPTKNKNAHKHTEKEAAKLARLGSMRIWGLKRKLAV